MSPEVKGHLRPGVGGIRSSHGYITHVETYGA